MRGMFGPVHFHEEEELEGYRQSLREREWRTTLPPPTLAPPAPTLDPIMQDMMQIVNWTELEARFGGQGLSVRNAFGLLEEEEEVIPAAYRCTFPTLPTLRRPPNPPHTPHLPFLPYTPFLISPPSSPSPSSSPSQGLRLGVALHPRHDQGRPQGPRHRQLPLLAHLDPEHGEHAAAGDEGPDEGGGAAGPPLPPLHLPSPQTVQGDYGLHEQGHRGDGGHHERPLHPGAHHPPRPFSNHQVNFPIKETYKAALRQHYGDQVRVLGSKVPGGPCACELREPAADHPEED